MTSVIINLTIPEPFYYYNFESTTDALSSATHLVDSKLPKGLRKFLKAECAGETLVVADSKLGKAISDKLVC
jgi:nucleolar protein 58